MSGEKKEEVQLDTAGKVIKCKAAVAWSSWDEVDKNPLTIEDIEVEPQKYE